MIVGPPGGALEGGDVEAARQPQAAVEQKPTPRVFALRQNQPNPFSDQTTIHFDLPVNTEVHLRIYDAQGRLVRRLAEGAFPAGFHRDEWAMRDGRSIVGGCLPLPNRSRGLPRPEEDGAVAVARTHRPVAGAGRRKTPGP